MGEYLIQLIYHQLIVTRFLKKTMSSRPSVIQLRKLSYYAIIKHRYRICNHHLNTEFSVNDQLKKQEVNE